MSYDLNRLRGTHPPMCTCVECTQRRNRRQNRRGRGGPGSGPGRRRFGCLPMLVAAPLVALALAAALTL